MTLFMIDFFTNCLRQDQFQPEVKCIIAPLVHKPNADQKLNKLFETMATKVSTTMVSMLIKCSIYRSSPEAISMNNSKILQPVG